MSESGLCFAIVGATGAVGREMLSVLEEHDLPVARLKLLASARSAGTELDYKGKSIIVEELTADSFQGVDIALFSAGGSISLEFAPIAAQAGAVVIDNSSAFRMDPDVILAVPEVNGSLVRKTVSELKNGQGVIIANPNCSTIQLVVVLKPLHDKFNLRRVVISTYQSVSGAGQKGMDELWDQTLAICNQQEVKKEKFPHQIAFNCLPHIDVFLENGYTKEEMKVLHESRKILDMPDLKLTCTAVRVPVFNCHAESVNVETERKATVKDVRSVLREAAGVMLMDDPQENVYPINTILAGTDATYVGRIREDESIDNGINLWIVADNLRKGAALNALQIASIVVDAKN